MMFASLFSTSAKSFGYGFIFLATLLEFLGLPAPGGLLVALAAASLAGDRLRFLPLITVAAVASVVGNVPWYFLGRFGGVRLLRGYCKFTLGSRFCVRHAESFFRQLGGLSLVVSKLISGVRAFAAPVAGIQGYSFGKFFLLDLLGGLIWAAFFAVTGRVIGPVLALHTSNETVVAFTVIPFLVFLLFRIIRRLVKGPAEEILQSSPEVGPAKVPAAESLL